MGSLKSLGHPGESFLGGLWTVTIWHFLLWWLPWFSSWNFMLCGHLRQVAPCFFLNVMLFFNPTTEMALIFHLANQGQQFGVTLLRLPDPPATACHWPDAAYILGNQNLFPKQRPLTTWVTRWQAHSLQTLSILTCPAWSHVVSLLHCGGSSHKTVSSHTFLTLMMTSCPCRTKSFIKQANKTSTNKLTQHPQWKGSSFF